LRGAAEGGSHQGGSSGVRRDGELVEEPRTGRVTAFDDDRGLGVITGDDESEIGFHCTAIADGTRTINVGVEVSYVTRARHLGRWEASDIRPA
jgi:cold shock CspA family protein